MNITNTFHLPPRWATDTIKVLLVGAGGTGSQVADQLASMQATLMQLGHPGLDVHFADGDTVSRFNLGRQRFTGSDIGLNKAAVLTHRINLFYQLNWTAILEKINPTSLSTRYDLLITCTDSAKFRAAIAKRFKAIKTDALWLDCGNADKNGQVVLGHLGRPANAQFTGAALTRLPNIVDLYPELATNTTDYDADALPSCSTEQALSRQDFPINRVAAITATDLLWSLLRHARITTHGAHFQSNPLSIHPIHIDPEAWAFYGYKAKVPSTRKKTGEKP